jgi:hypothetical protein
LSLPRAARRTRFKSSVDTLARHIRCCEVRDRARRSFARRLPAPAAEKREPVKGDIRNERLTDASLHDAVTLSKLADMRPILPLLRSTPLFDAA